MASSRFSSGVSVLEFEEQLVAETADGLVVLLVQRDQHDVLRIGQPQLVEHRLVEAVHGQVRGIDRETQEIVEFCRLVRARRAVFAWPRP